MASTAGEAGPAVDTPGVLSRNWAQPLVDAALAGQPAPLSSAESAVMIAATEQALARFDSEPGRLPRRPQMLPQLLSTLNDDDASGRDITMIIARDPALAANLLALANSALYRSQPTPVESLDRAVAQVGTDGLRQLVAVALMQPVMRVEGGIFGRLPELLWDHTQHAAQAAAQFARTIEREDAFAAQLLALLHGLGAIVVVQALRETSARQQPTAPPEAASVAALLQREAPRIARRVAREWDLSERLMCALDDQALDDLAAMGGLGRALAVGAARVRIA